jgi:Cof subfamily protein (haloacid dehalogenase superfamily)
MIERLKTVIADIDGTLNLKGHALGPRTIAALERLHKMGVLFGTASGRPLDQRTLDNAKLWGLSFPFDLAIGMNGGDLWDKDHEGVEHIMLLEAEHVREILGFMWPLDCNIMVYENAYDHVLTKQVTERFEFIVERVHAYWEVSTLEEMGAKDTGKIEIQYEPEAEEEVLGAIAAHPSPHWSSVKTSPGTVEFMKPGLNKGVALRRYAERNAIPVSQIMAVGDMDNDIAMIDAAGWGVCMANGCDEAKAVADAITEYGVLEDGFGRYFEDHVF